MTKPKDRLTHKQREIIYKQRQDSAAATQWLKSQGIKDDHLHIGIKEMFEAAKLATNTLKHNGRLLSAEEAQTLNRFLLRTGKKSRSKITQGQCWTVMNIAKAAVRRAAKAQKNTQQRIRKLRHARKQSPQGNTPVQTMG
jgi:hypothetical protein